MRFDVAVLVECDDPETALHVRESGRFSDLCTPLDDIAGRVHCVVAENPVSIADVDKSRNGVFLFNYFFANGVARSVPDAAEVVVGVRKYTAGWWTAKANLTDSTPLQPLNGENSDYALINHCRWDRLLDFVPHLVLRPTLRSFVVANFDGDALVTMPLLYRLV